jgi:hypothetical protein
MLGAALPREKLPTITQKNTCKKSTNVRSSEVFFCVMVGSFSLGNAAPNIGTLFGAKGAAANTCKKSTNVRSSVTKGETSNHNTEKYL